tara:strand:- start:545 stop:712 length:168 start_codon:yes stop_codon:yes gene_type:complete
MIKKINVCNFFKRYIAPKKKDQIDLKSMKFDINLYEYFKLNQEERNNFDKKHSKN